MPADPFDGHRPLKLRSDVDGTWVVYSAGLDGRDDGGDAGEAMATEFRGSFRPNPEIDPKEWRRNRSDYGGMAMGLGAMGMDDAEPLWLVDLLPRTYTDLGFAGQLYTPPPPQTPTEL